jgi:hypothetical protein
MEIWKPVVNYEGLYEVSTFGNIKSLQRKGCKEDRILKPVTTLAGYLTVCLCKNKTEKICRVHRLVGLAFLELVDGKPEINHKNRIRNDNRLENLEWANDVEQMANCSTVLEAKYHCIHYYDKNPRLKSKWRVRMYGPNNSNEKYKHFKTEADAIEFCKTL